MKKLLLFVAVATFTFSVAQSQDLRFGAKAGLNLASIGGDDTDDLESRTSFHIGGLVEIPISEKFAVQPELLYSSQGAKEEYSESYNEAGFNFTVTETSKLKLGYINIPVMAKFYLIEGLALEAGPQFGFLISAKGDTDVEISGNLPREFEEMIEDEYAEGEIDLKDEFKTLDLGFGLGASYRLDFGLFFSARYIIGISDITEDYEYEIFGETVVIESKQKNNLLQLSVGYTF